MKKRGFEIVEDKYRKHLNKKINLPIRGSKGSAGYDFYSPETFILKANEKKIIWTDIKSYMQEDEVLKIYIRSSIGIKRGLILCNGTGIIDKDYYSNVSNDGNIGIAITNISENEVEIKENERIAQGIFQKYLIADNDKTTDERLGGIGSTGN